jgi:hypothetical protein
VTAMQDMSRRVYDLALAQNLWARRAEVYAFLSRSTRSVSSMVAHRRGAPGERSDRSGRERKPQVRQDIRRDSRRWERRVRKRRVGSKRRIRRCAA